MSHSDLKFGVFRAPVHSSDENPTDALAEELQRVQLLEELGYNCVWLTEGHSSDSQFSISPELLFAASARVTKQIRFGASTASLHCSNLLALADKMAKLHHETRGRTGFSIALDTRPSVNAMPGSGSPDQQTRALESINVLVPLLRGETVTRQTSWFELNDARLRVAPLSNKPIKLSVASQISPAGARIAGTHGLGLISVSATSALGFDSLPTNWEIYQRAAKLNNQQADRRNWTLVGPVHIAESSKLALEEVRFGLRKWLAYFRDVADLQIVAPDERNPAAALVESGLAVIGTADDAIAQIKALEAQSGGFGQFMQMTHNWADRDASRKSIELFARHVIPEFQSANREDVSAASPSQNMG